MPWEVSSEDHIDLGEVRRQLDEDHYGLDKIKKRMRDLLIYNMGNDGDGYEIWRAHGTTNTTDDPSQTFTLIESLRDEFRKICDLPEDQGDEEDGPP